MEGLFEGILGGLLKEKGYARAYEVPADINVPVGFIRTQLGNIVPEKITVYDLINIAVKKVERLGIPWKKVISKKSPETLLHVYENTIAIYVYNDRVAFVTALQQDSFVILYEQRVVGMHVDPKNFGSFKTTKICTQEKARLNFDVGKSSPRLVFLGALVALAKHIRNDNDGFVSYVDMEVNHIKPIRAFKESIWPHNVELAFHHKNVEHSIVWDKFKENGLIIKRLSILDNSTLFEVYSKNQLHPTEATLENYGMDFIHAENTEELIDYGMKPSYIEDELFKN